MKIAAIIPVYNEEERVEECLESILNANPDEVVIVDDGSAGQTPEICKKYSQNYENVNYFRQENQGQGIARNLGVEKADSELVCFIDADMIVEEDYFEKMKEALEKYDMVGHIEHRMTENWVSEYNAKVRDYSVKKPCAPRGMKKSVHLKEDGSYYHDKILTRKLKKEDYSLGMSEAEAWHYESTSFSVFKRMGKDFIRYNFNWKSFLYSITALTPLFMVPALVRAIKYKHWKTFFAEWIAKFYFSISMLKEVLRI